MDDYSVEITSLCIVSRDSSDQVWLNRLADVKNEKLVSPVIFDNEPRYFENRERIYYNDGPSQENTIGVWRWTAIPKRQNPDTDYVQSFYQWDCNPIRIFPVAGAMTDDQLIDKLTEGVIGFAYGCDTIFVYGPQKELYRGVLCKKEEFVSENGAMKLREDIFSLPLFDIPIDDVHYIKKYPRFLKSLRVGDPVGYITIGNVNDIIRTIVLERLTWPLYKECISGTKAEWRSCKTMLEKICSESLYEALAEKLNCSIDQAKLSVEKFAERANALIDDGDVDSDVLAQVAVHHEGLRAQCEVVVEGKWRISHAAEIALAEADIQKAMQQLQTIEQEKHTASEEKTAILVKIADSQRKLDSLLKEIEQYEALGNDTVQAVRTKIGEAQKDVAGFIAELSVFMPQPKTEVEEPRKPRICNHWRFIEGYAYDEDEEVYGDDIEECSRWEDTLDLLKSNLQLAGVGEQWVGFLSAFLYSAYINKAHLLLAGPNAKNIADAVALAVMGKKIAVIECYGEKEQNAILAAYVAKDRLIAVENPFHPDWLSCMPYVNYGVCNIEKTMFWLHPFTEDLPIEPCGLYNYVLPVFTECFVEHNASWRLMTAGTNEEDFEAFNSGKNAVAQMRHVKKLGVSKLVINRLQKVLSDAKRMSGSSNSDMEYLFALLPFSVLKGKQDVLKEALENEKNISSTVKSEVQRYIEEE